MSLKSGEKLPIGPALLLWLAISAVLVFTGWDHVVTRSGWDPDDQLRLVQLRDFLGGQSWFDTTQYRMNPADGAPMHWSRLIELPLALVVLLFQPLVGTARAEMAAGVLVPMLCFGGIALLLGRIAARLGGTTAGLVAFFLTLISPALLIQLRPMRIDHHGWQLFCAALALSSLFWPSKRKGGVVLGLALAVWLHISLEGAPMTAAFFLLLGWRWIAEKAEGVRLFWTILAFALASFALFLGTSPQGLLAAQYCDTVSPAHIAAIAAASTILLPAIKLKPEARWLRLAATAAAGAAAIGLLLWIAPGCAKGAFADLDPVVREYWYAKVSEGLPAWRQNLQTAVTLLSVPLVALLAFAALAKVEMTPKAKSEFRTVGFLLLYATLLSLLVFRTVSVATAYAIIPTSLWIAHLLSMRQAVTSLWPRLALVAAALLLLIPGSVAGTVIGKLRPGTAQTDNSNKSEPKAVAKLCESAKSVAALAKLPKAIFVAPFDMGPAILLTTSHRVLASSHHRNRRGMRDHIDIFRLPPEQSRQILLRRGISHIAVCPTEGEMQFYARKHPDGLWGQLDKGKTPDWLEYAGEYGDRIKVWRLR